MKTIFYTLLPLLVSLLCMYGEEEGVVPSESAEELPIWWMHRGESEVWSVPIVLSYGALEGCLTALSGELQTGLPRIHAGSYESNFYEHWYRENFWYFGENPDEFLFQWTLYKNLRAELDAWMKEEKIPDHEQTVYLQQFDHLWRVVSREERLRRWDTPRREDLQSIFQENPLPKPMVNLLQVLAHNPNSIGEKEIQLLQQLTQESHPAFAAFPVRAHFLLGLIQLQKDPAAAQQQFQALQEKVKEGAKDPEQCAAQSLGWGSMIPYQRGDWLQALHGYLKSYQEGYEDWVSLDWTLAAMAKQEQEVLAAYAQDESATRLLTVWILSNWRTERRRQVLRNWMPLVWDSPSLQQQPEILALAAYELDDKQRSAEYLQRIPSEAESELSLFLRARLALEAGHAEQAMEFYNQVLLMHAHQQRRMGDDYYKRSLWYDGAYRARAERAFLHLKRNEYMPAMSWMVYVQRGDVAMLAERILTLDELIAFTENPHATREGADASGLKECAEWGSRYPVESILARRLARADRWNEAAGWFEKSGEKQSATQARQIHDWKTALEDPALSNEERAHLLWQIAQMLRASGLELIGTEYAPDYKISDGTRDFPRYYEAEVFRVRKPFPYSEETLRRIAESAPKPDLRWHYRYVAAEYGWQAAQYLPDNDDLTAYILWQSGHWIMYANPQYADRFYKSLVRRNRQTELGKTAEQLRWFPRTWPRVGSVVPADR
jgi:hypothetical protein